MLPIPRKLSTGAACFAREETSSISQQLSICCMQLPWQQGASRGCRPGCQRRARGQGRGSFPTSLGFLQRGPSARSCVCTGAQSRGFPGEPQPQQVTNTPLPPLPPPEWAERFAPGLQGGPCEDGGGAAAQGDRFGDNDQGEDKGAWSH